MQESKDIRDKSDVIKEGILKNRECKDPLLLMIQEMRNEFQADIETV